jgi:hypothetical protein
MNLLANECTPYPVDAQTHAVLDEFPDDILGRAVVRLPAGASWQADEWTPTVDERTGSAIEIRRASCGLGCKCAAEVRLKEGG